MTLSGSRCSSFELFVFFWALRGQEGEGDTRRAGGGAQRGQAGRFNATQKPAEITREGGPRDKVRVRATLFPWSQTPRRRRALVHT